MSGSSEETSPGGHVVVLFGSAADEWCSLNKCPMGLVRWFADHDEARRYAETVPDGYEPHVLTVDPR